MWLNQSARYIHAIHQKLIFNQICSHCGPKVHQSCLKMNSFSWKITKNSHYGPFFTKLVNFLFSKYSIFGLRTISREIRSRLGVSLEYLPEISGVTWCNQWFNHRKNGKCTKFLAIIQQPNKWYNLQRNLSSVWLWNTTLSNCNHKTPKKAPNLNRLPKIHWITSSSK
jgi:hypothetical protein